MTCSKTLLLQLSDNCGASSIVLSPPGAVLQDPVKPASLAAHPPEQFMPPTCDSTFQANQASLPAQPLAEDPNLPGRSAVELKIPHNALYGSKEKLINRDRLANFVQPPPRLNNPFCYEKQQAAF